MQSIICASMKPAVTIYVFLDQTDAEILPYTVLFARKQTDTEGESCNIAFNILTEPRNGVCKTVERKISVLDQMLQNALAFFL